MKGYVIWLFVALACSSMADDTKRLEARLDKTNWIIETVTEVFEVNQRKMRRETNIRSYLQEQIHKIQEDLLNDQLKLAKVNVMLERRNLLLEQCLNPEKGKQGGLDRMVKERADEIEAETERNATEAMIEKYDKLLQLPALSPIEVVSTAINLFKS